MDLCFFQPYLRGNYGKKTEDFYNPQQAPAHKTHCYSGESLSHCLLKKITKT